MHPCRRRLSLQCKRALNRQHGCKMGVPGKGRRLRDLDLPCPSPVTLSHTACIQSFRAVGAI